jgi:hypothetical protein
MMNRPGRPTIDPAGLGETPSRANLLVGVSLGLKKRPSSQPPMHRIACPAVLSSSGPVSRRYPNQPAFIRGHDARRRCLTFPARSVLLRVPDRAFQAITPF